jgi:hypothetical protein
MAIDRKKEFDDQILKLVKDTLSGADSELVASMISSQIIGLALTIAITYHGKDDALNETVTGIEYQLIRHTAKFANFFNQLKESHKKK